MSKETTLNQNQFEFEAKYLHGEKETITVQLATPANTPSLRGKKGLEFIQEFANLIRKKQQDDNFELIDEYAFVVERILKTFNTKHSNDDSEHSWYNIVNFAFILNKYFEVYMPYIQDFFLFFFPFLPVLLNVTFKKSTN